MNILFCSEAKHVQHFFEDQPQLLDRAFRAEDTRVRVDPFTQVITTFRELAEPDTQRVLALVGAQWERPFFAALWQQARENGDHWNDCNPMDGLKCMLVTSDLFIVASNQKHAALHLSLEEPELLDHLVKQGVVTM